MKFYLNDVILKKKAASMSILRTETYIDENKENQSKQWYIYN